MPDINTGIVITNFLLLQLLAPSAECRSLQELAVSESFNRNDSGARNLQVGVDARYSLFGHSVYDC